MEIKIEIIEYEGILLYREDEYVECLSKNCKYDLCKFEAIMDTCPLCENLIKCSVLVLLEYYRIVKQNDVKTFCCTCYGQIKSVQKSRRNHED